MQPTRLCLVRHGETAWNAENRLQGHQDIPLNARGVQQAQAAAIELQPMDFAAVYSSDLQRARTTAQIIAKAAGRTVIPSSSLRERNLGALQGLTREEAAQHYPAEYALVRSRAVDAQPPGKHAESLRAFAERVAASITEIANHHTGQCVLIVTHGGCLDVIYRLATGKTLEAPRDFPLENATLNWLTACHGNFDLISWNARSHLQRVKDEISV